LPHRMQMNCGLFINSSGEWIKHVHWANLCGKTLQIYFYDNNFFLNRSPSHSISSLQKYPLKVLRKRISIRCPSRWVGVRATFSHSRFLINFKAIRAALFAKGDDPRCWILIKEGQFFFGGTNFRVPCFDQRLFGYSGISCGRILDRVPMLNLREKTD
jgi:hypothetical protein